ncbi:MAG: HlyC/CorC family transporter [Bacteroidales bacterium]|nr:HlyC/CorC family transporter [Bacteroidales bacterium]
MGNLFIIFVTLVLSAFFSGMEIAFISSNRLRIELDKKQGVFASRIIGIFVDNPGKFLTTMLVGNNIALVIYGIVMAAVLKPVLNSILSSSSLILILQTFFSTLLILLTAEFLPKVVFRSVSNQTLNLFSVPGYFFYLMFYPLTRLIVWLADSIINRLHGHQDIKTSGQVFNKIDLINLINQSNKDEHEESNTENDFKIFQNALDFSSVKVRDCMVPRTEIVALDIASPVEELHQRFINTGFSKILIYEDNPDNMVGYVTSKSLLKKMKTIREKMIGIPFVPETMPARRMLEIFIQEKKSIAVVVDEFGGVSGMLTIEDIIEEIFGEIEDEHDTSELIEKQVSESEYILSGRLEIDYLNEKYNLNIPESEEYETLTGLIFQNYENIPELNESIIIGNFTFKILKVSNTKIELIHMKINPD